MIHRTSGQEHSVTGVATTKEMQGSIDVMNVRSPSFAVGAWKSSQCRFAALLLGLGLVFFLLMLTRSAAAQGAPQTTTFQEVQGLLAQGKQREALVKLKGLVKRPEAPPGAFLYLGSMLREQGDVTGALGVFERGTVRFPTDVMLHAEVGITLSWLERFEASLASFNRALALDPTHSPSRLGRARVLSWMGELDQAKDGYESVLEDAPQDLEAKRGLGFVYRLELDYDRARAYYRQVLVREPKDEASLEALVLMDRATRWSLLGSAGYVAVPDLQTVGGLARVSYQATRSTNVWGRYEVTNFPGGLGSLTGDFGSTLSHWGSLGVIQRITKGWTGEAAYEVRVQDTVTHRAPLRSSVVLGKQWVVLGGARPGVDNEGRVETLADLGLQWVVSDPFWVMVQGYGFYDTDGQSSAIGVGTVFWQFLKWWSVRMAGGTGTINDELALTFAATSRWDVSRGLGFALQYEWMGEPFLRQSLYATVELRL